VGRKAHANPGRDPLDALLGLYGHPAIQARPRALWLRALANLDAVFGHNKATHGIDVAAV